MNEVYHRHELYPYVFEEQTMVLMDNVGNRDVRKMRRFSRVEEDETLKLTLSNPVNAELAQSSATGTIEDVMPEM